MIHLVTVKLTGDSSLSRFVVPNLEGLPQEITRTDSASVSLRWALVRGKDKNLLFTFEESDREELLAIEGNMQTTVLREFGVDTLELLESRILPAKKKASKAKSKTSTTKKTTSKAKKD